MQRLTDVKGILPPAPKQRINLKFSNNWNNKLDCLCFTTIRLWQPERLFTGQKVHVFLADKDKWIDKGTGIIIDVKSLRMEQINTFIANIDTGYDVENTKKIIARMYPNILNPSLALCLVKYDQK